jgi:hypothetical protein
MESISIYIVLTTLKNKHSSFDLNTTGQLRITVLDAGIAPSSAHSVNTLSLSPASSKEAL